jgi:fatty-acyl-CoA synthase
VQDTLGRMFVRGGRRYAGLDAVRSGNGSRTHAEVLANAARLANVLRAHELEPGDRVAMMLENTVEAVEVAAGIALGGFVMVPVNGHFKAAELDHQLRDSGARALVHTAGVSGAVGGAAAASALAVVLRIGGEEPGEGDVLGYATALAEADPELRVHEPDPDDLAAIGYTSGTTGFPKGAMVTQGSIMLCIRSCLGILRIPHYSRLAYIGSLGYAAPWLTIILPHLFAGGMVNLITNYTVDSWFATMAHDKTTFTYVPSPLIDRFVQEGRRHPDVIAQLETVNHSASAATREEIDKLVDLVGDKYFHGWGATEFAGGGTCLTRNDAIGLGAADDPRATVGRPAPTTRLFVLDDAGEELPRGRGNVGELAVEVDTLFAGYWNEPEQTAAAFSQGRYLTGDIGWVDHQGYAYIVDRKRDMIVSGGANVYPAEVERVLRGLDGLAEVAVFGVPHERWGESVAAAVVRRPGSSLSEEDVIAYAKEHLASFKKPTAVHFVDELPRNASQKVRKDVLRAQVAEARSAEARS